MKQAGRRGDFWSKAKRQVDGCWIWQGARTSHASGIVYGRFKVDGLYRMAHRVAWQKTHGLIPDGMKVCHCCDVPLCINPAHLWLGTQADNIHDMWAKGRGNPARGFRNINTKLSDEQVIELRALREAGITYSVLGSRFGITKGHAHRIVNHLAR